MANHGRPRSRAVRPDQHRPGRGQPLQARWSRAFLRDFPFTDLDFIRPEWLEVLRAGGRSLRLDLRVGGDEPVPIIPHVIAETDLDHPEANRLGSLGDLFDRMSELLDRGHWAFDGWQWGFAPDVPRRHRTEYPWMF